MLAVAGGIILAFIVLAFFEEILGLLIWVVMIGVVGIGFILLFAFLASIVS